MEARRFFSYRYFTDRFEPQNLVMMLSQMARRRYFFEPSASPLLELALVLVRFNHVAPELDGSSHRGRLTSSPPQFGQAKFICTAQLAQYVHS
jgi:hypothetical protein